MRNTLAVLILVFGLVSVADADVWSWVDASGKTHFVDTQTTIYTWVDENGDVHYSDTPDHEAAVAVVLVWVSSGSLDQLQAKNDDAGATDFLPGETEEDRAEREKAEAYYCKRATEIYDSYVNAPRLYKTGADGEREYLSKEDSAKTIAETRAQKDDLCR
jgi:hypothetical protein